MPSELFIIVSLDSHAQGRFLLWFFLAIGLVVLVVDHRAEKSHVLLLHTQYVNNLPRTQPNALMPAQALTKYSPNIQWLTSNRLTKGDATCTSSTKGGNMNTNDIPVRAFGSRATVIIHRTATEPTDRKTAHAWLPWPLSGQSSTSFASQSSLLPSCAQQQHQASTENDRDRDTCKVTEPHTRERKGHGDRQTKNRVNNTIERRSEGG